LEVLEDFFAGLDDSVVACSVDFSTFVEERVTRLVGSGADVDSVVLRFLDAMLADGCLFLLSALILAWEKSDWGRRERLLH
jgi:hypothetical protein